MEPAAGIEPATDGLQNRCSTAELSWQLKLPPLPRIDGLPSRRIFWKRPGGRQAYSSLLSISLRLDLLSPSL